MATLTVTNWFGNIVSHPQVVVEASSKDEIIAILKDPAKYPVPGPGRRLQPFHSLPAEWRKAAL